MKHIIAGITIFILLGIVSFRAAHAAGEFTAVDAGLPAQRYGGVSWADYDNDGDLDLFTTGQNAPTQIYINDDGTFTLKASGLPDALYPDFAWGDYDNDGDLDLLLTGTRPDLTGFASVYRNDSGTFTALSLSLPQTVFSFAGTAWGDYDGDGDLDFLIAGNLYRNNGNSFSPVDTDLPGESANGGSFGDYDNDGDLDILIGGSLYQNNNGSFSLVEVGLPGFGGSNDWGDYDNDGDLDILLTNGVYRNDGGTFTNINASLATISYGGSALWGDYDNDGDLDILQNGNNGTESVTEVYRNDGNNQFTAVGAGLVGMERGVIAWGDYDNDGDLDIALTGANAGNASVGVALYKNNTSAANTAPSAPTGLSAAQLSADTVMLSWNPAVDEETPALGLSYSLAVSTTSGGVDLVSPASDLATGYRRVVELGNAQKGTTFILSGLPLGTYYWRVQAVDTAFAGSAFSDEAAFDVLTPTQTPPPPTPTSTPEPPTPTELVANGGFENGLAPWTLKNGTRDKIKCNDATRTFAYTGLCAFQFRGGAGEKAKLSQNIDFSSVNLAANDTLNFAAYVKAGSTVAGKLKVVVKYSDNTPADKIKLDLTPAADYTLFPDSVTLTSGAVSKIKVQISSTSPSGKLFVDDISLSLPPTDGLIRLPQ